MATPINVSPQVLNYGLDMRFAKHLEAQYEALILSGSAGFTLDWRGLQVNPTSGYAVSWRRLDESDFQWIIMRRATKTKAFAGYWRDADGIGHRDITFIFQDKEEALTFAAIWHQRCVYDFSTNTEVYQ